MPRKVITTNIFPPMISRRFGKLVVVSRADAQIAAVREAMRHIDDRPEEAKAARFIDSVDRP